MSSAPPRDYRVIDVKMSDYLASPGLYLDPSKHDRVVVHDDKSDKVSCLITMRPEPDPLP